MLNLLLCDRSLSQCLDRKKRTRAKGPLRSFSKYCLDFILQKTDNSRGSMSCFILVASRSHFLPLLCERHRLFYLVVPALLPDPDRLPASEIRLKTAPGCLTHISTDSRRARSNCNQSFLSRLPTKIPPSVPPSPSP